MTETVKLNQDFECVLKIKGDHIKLGDSLHEYISEHFVNFCNNHKYHPTTASVSVDKIGEQFEVQMHLHLNQKDFHSHGENADVYKATQDAFHLLQHNISKIK